jgi:hypothetical protein
MSAQQQRSGSVYLTRIAVTLGEQEPIETGAKLTAAELELLRSEGLRSCRVSSEPAVSLAAAAARESLRSAAAPNIDLVVVTSMEPRQLEGWSLLVAAGIPKVPITAVSGDACANLLPALRLARNAILAGDARRVLVVTADVMPWADRYLVGGPTVLSDGAAACIVAAEPDGPSFEILGFGTTMNAGHDEHDFPNANAQIIATSMRAAAGRLPATGDPTPYSYVLTPNYGERTRQFLALAAGLKGAEGYAPVVAEVGHCFSADALINLQLLAGDGVRGGDKVAVLATSFRSWSVMALRYAGEDPAPDSAGGTAMG